MYPWLIECGYHIRCAHKEQSLLLDLIKAFVRSRAVTNQIFCSSKRPIFFHTRATCPEFPSNMSTMTIIVWCLHVCAYRLIICRILRIKKTIIYITLCVCLSVSSLSPSATGCIMYVQCTSKVNYSHFLGTYLLYDAFVLQSVTYSLTNSANMVLFASYLSKYRS